MDLMEKIWLGCIVSAVLTALVGVHGCNVTNQKMVEKGYSQEKITYCSGFSTSMIWVKNTVDLTGARK